MPKLRNPILLPAWLLAALTAALLTATPAQTASPPSPAPRLEGVFKVAGTVIRSDPTFSLDVGQKLQRRWQFFAKCPEGPCAQTILRRTAPGGHRFMFINKTGADSYGGITSFVTHANKGFCHFRYHDELTLQVTASALIAGVTRATKTKSRIVERLTSSDCTLKPREQRAVVTFTGQLR